MIEIQNKKVTDWVAECAAMTKPKEIVWIDGSEAQLDAIRALAGMQTGEMVKLNEEKLPGLLLLPHRSEGRRQRRKAEPSSVRRRRRMPVRPTIGWTQRTKCTPKLSSAVRRRHGGPHDVRDPLLHGRGRQSVLQSRHRADRLHLCRSFHGHHDPHRAEGDGLPGRQRGFRQRACTPRQDLDESETLHRPVPGG